MKKDVTTVQLHKSVVGELKAIKKYPRQTYNEIIMDLITRAKNPARVQERTQNQYDEFLHKIQQLKMKELWDNAEDEAWENA